YDGRSWPCFRWARGRSSPAPELRTAPSPSRCPTPPRARDHRPPAARARSRRLRAPADSRAAPGCRSRRPRRTRIAAHAAVRSGGFFRSARSVDRLPSSVRATSVLTRITRTVRAFFTSFIRLQFGTAPALGSALPRRARRLPPAVGARQRQPRRRGRLLLVLLPGRAQGAPEPGELGAQGLVAKADLIGCLLVEVLLQEPGHGKP